MTHIRKIYVYCILSRILLDEIEKAGIVTFPQFDLCESFLRALPVDHIAACEIHETLANNARRHGHQNPTSPSATLLEIFVTTMKEILVFDGNGSIYTYDGVLAEFPEMLNLAMDDRIHGRLSVRQWHEIGKRREGLHRVQCVVDEMR